MSAAARWAEQLGAWAVPQRVRERAPERDPWSLDPARFVERAEAADGASPADVAGREALGGAGTVLDVGCGAGAATVGLGDAVRAATGVDAAAEMLAAYRDVLGRRGVPVTTVEGWWPDVADRVPRHDLVAAHHVVHNVADVAGFLDACRRAARRRVVLVLPVTHPRAWTAPYWAALHDLARPDGPVLDDLLAVLAELGISPQVVRTPHPSMAPADADARRAHLLDHLCLHDDRAPELAAVDAELQPLPATELATLWWDTR